MFKFVASVEDLDTLISVMFHVSVFPLKQLFYSRDTTSKQDCITKDYSKTIFSFQAIRDEVTFYLFHLYSFGNIGIYHGYSS